MGFSEMRNGRMLFCFSRSSAACVFGVGVYGEHRGKTWHRLTIIPLYKIGNKIHGLVWKMRYRFSPDHRYNLIDTGLPPGCYPPAITIKHGLFSALKAYAVSEYGGVEELKKHVSSVMEDPDPNAPEEWISEEIKFGKEMLRVLEWWENDYPAMGRRANELYNAAYEKHGSPFKSTYEDGAYVIHCASLSDEEAAMKKEAKEIRKKMEGELQAVLKSIIDLRPNLL